MQGRVCEGCGATLQSEDPATPGYVPGRVMQGTSRALCRRCHRLRAHGTSNHRDDESSGSVRRVVDQGDLVLLVVDVLDFEGTFSKRLTEQCGRRLFIVANKVDLLPGKTPHSEVLAWLQNRITSTHAPNKGVFLISATKGFGVAALWDAVKKELGGRGTVVIVGVDGVGKTTLINTWIEQNTRQETKKKRPRRKPRKVHSETSAADPETRVVTEESSRESAMPSELVPKVTVADEATANVATEADVSVAARSEMEVVTGRHSSSLPLEDGTADENKETAKAVNPPRRRRRPSRPRSKANKPKAASNGTAESKSEAPAPAKRPNPVAKEAAEAVPSSSRSGKRNRHRPRRRGPSPKKPAGAAHTLEPTKVSGEAVLEGTDSHKSAAATRPAPAPATAPEARQMQQQVPQQAASANIAGEPIATQLPVGSQNGKQAVVGVKIDRSDIRVLEAPGITGRGRINTLLCGECAQKTSVQRPLRSKVLRMKPGQAAIFAGIAAVSVQQAASPEKTAFMLLFTPPAISVQRVREFVVQQFLATRDGAWHLDVCDDCASRLRNGGWEEVEVVLDATRDLVIHGLGWISARQSAVTLKVVVPAGALTSLRPRLVGPKDSAE